jgi:hypothetical protein
MSVTAERWRRANGIAAIVWTVLGVPTLLWWRSSILWLALMSLWANVASHLAVWTAGRAETNSGNRREGASQ